ncbi:MAG: energy transducer TonB [Pseudomonadota bacterium]
MHTNRSRQFGKSNDIVLLLLALLAFGGMLAWFFLGSDTQVVEDEAILAPIDTDESEVVRAIVEEAQPGEELLNKARLAAAAGMLVEPVDNSALQLYADYLEQYPDSAEAATELEAVADQVGEQISEASSAQDWDAAATLSQQLVNAGVPHPSIDAFSQALDTARADLSSAALDAANRGDEDEANSTIEQLASLPRTAPGDVLELRSSVRDALVAKRVADRAAAEAEAARQASQRQAAAQRAAEQQRERERQRQAASEAAATQSAPTQATPAADPLDALRAALSANRYSGNNNAFDVYAGLQTDSQIAGDAKALMIPAVAEQIRDRAAGADPIGAEALQRQLATIDANAAGQLQAAVDRAFIEQATAQTVSAATLRLVQSVPPSYPRAALRRQVEGRVKLEFTVDTDGVPRDIEVVEATSTLFNRSALQAVSQWRYQPREVRGQAVAQRVYAYLEYALQ